MLCRVLLDANSGEHQLRLIEIHPRWFQKVFRAKRWLNMHENALLKSNMEPESSKVFFQDFEPTSTSVLESFPLFFWREWFASTFLDPNFRIFHPFKDGGRHPHLHQGMWASAVPSWRVCASQPKWSAPLSSDATTCTTSSPSHEESWVGKVLGWFFGDLFWLVLLMVGRNPQLYQLMVKIPLFTFF